jgi:hypothetical protein
LLTPVIRAIKRDFPGWPIFVESKCSEVFHGNPDVAGNSTEADMPDALVIDFNGSYEARPERHILTVTLLFDNVACVAMGSICRDCEKAPRQHIICLHMY